MSADLTRIAAGLYAIGLHGARIGTAERYTRDGASHWQAWTEDGWSTQRSSLRTAADALAVHVAQTAPAEATA